MQFGQKLNLLKQSRRQISLVKYFKNYPPTFEYGSGLQHVSMSNRRASQWA